MYPEDSLLPISALQHLLFCERQCALIHIERLWVENRLTVEGRHLHRRAHEARSHWQGDVFVARGLRLRSLRLGLVGQTDIVEFHPPARAGPDSPAATGHRSSAADLPAPLARGGELTGGPLPPGWRVVPVEYKRGRPKAGDCDRVQLCAQAMCLEEMLSNSRGAGILACLADRNVRPTSLEAPPGAGIAAGALFYGQRRRRTDVPFDAALRATTEAAVARLRAMIAAGVTPKAVREKKCDSCSLLSLCMPGVLGPRAASAFVARQFTQSERSPGPLTDSLA
jgi:CRISPR-associated exonuclease Cas4